MVGTSISLDSIVFVPFSIAHGQSDGMGLATLGEAFFAVKVVRLRSIDSCCCLSFCYGEKEGEPVM